MDRFVLDYAHMLAGFMVLVSFMLLYQDRMFSLLNVFALQALVLAASVAWQAHVQAAPHLYVTAGIALVLKAIVIPLVDIYYPDWAKSDWSPGQGFPGTDAEALQQVLARLDGLIFGPGATVNESGELTAPSETGYLRIDNIYFR